MDFTPRRPKWVSRTWPNSQWWDWQSEWVSKWVSRMKDFYELCLKQKRIKPNPEEIIIIIRRTLLNGLAKSDWRKWNLMDGWSGFFFFFQNTSKKQKKHTTGSYRRMVKYIFKKNLLRRRWKFKFKESWAWH